MEPPQLSSSSDSDSDDDGRFDIKRASLLRQMRSILDQYPDDGQILKELLQNAEDAAASEVHFLYDENHYGTDTDQLLGRGLDKFQGAALYAYNDATFTKNDWKGIRMLQKSIKKNDPTKVGKFGLGFKSVFHMTDLPSILNGDQLAFIDPHEIHFSDEQTQRTGFCIKLGKDKTLLDRKAHLLEPFMDKFGCNSEHLRNGTYQGTIFRFPLRVQKSKLSGTLYNREKIEELFKSFLIDAPVCLLFLKNVKKVELSIRKRGKMTATKLFSVKISDGCVSDIQDKKSYFHRQIKDGKWLSQPQSVSYKVDVEQTQYPGKGALPKTIHKSYLVCEYFGGGNSAAGLNELSVDPGISSRPLVGVAAPMDPQDGAPVGQVFCSLPLPFEQRSSTGLPVHVNGVFSVSQNRRNLKWPSMNQVISNDRALQWNQGLLTELLPKAYEGLVSYAIDLIMQKQAICLPPHYLYSILPDISRIDDKWLVLVDSFYRGLLETQCLYTMQCGHGKQCLNAMQDTTCPNDDHWIQPKSAVLEDETIEDSLRDTISSLLVIGGVKVTNIPSHIRCALKRAEIQPSVVSPILLVTTLCNKPAMCENLDACEKYHLLQYILGGCQDLNSISLTGLPLLPLADNTWTTFTLPGYSSPVYIQTDQYPEELLHGMERSLLKQNLDPALKILLDEIAKSGMYQLETMTTEMMKSLLPSCVPFQSETSLKTKSTAGKTHQLLQWLSSLWDFLRRECNDISFLEGQFVLPSSDGDTVTVHKLQRPTNMMLKRDNTPAYVSNVMSKLGVIVVGNLRHVQNHAQAMETYIQEITPDSVVSVLLQVDRDQMEKLVRLCSKEELFSFRSYIAKVESSFISEGHKMKLRSLPVFETLNRNLACINDVNRAAPIERPGVKITANVLDIDDENALKLARMLDVEQYTLVEFLSSYVLPSFTQMSGDDKCTIIDFIKHRWLQMKLKGLERVLKNIPFVLTTKGKLRKPTDLFDPKSVILAKMYHDVPVFPSAEYMDDHSLNFLRDLGLKQEIDLKITDIISCAQKVEKIAKREDNLELAKTLSLGIALFLERYPQRLMQDQYQTDEPRLSEIEWIPVMQNKPSMYPESLPWKSDTNFQKPKHVKSKDWALQIGSVMDVCLWEDQKVLAQMFHWKEQPTIQELVLHLKIVIEQYNSKEKAEYIKVVSGIYSTLEKIDRQSLQEEFTKQNLEKWIWNGNGFSKPIHLIRKNALTMQYWPYLCEIPEEMSCHQDLFISFGAGSEYIEDTLVTVLDQIKEKYDENRFDHETQCLNSTCQEDLQIAIKVLNFLASNVDKMHDRDMSSIPMPVQSDDEYNLKLLPIKQCTYAGNAKEDEDLNYTHKMIPMKTAEMLGVHSLMRRLLNAEEMDWEDCDQGEPLTTRLRNILSEYQDGYALPKELIQNADDAGASVVKLLYDERTNEEYMTHLLDDGMASCHGPSLWAFNDAVFSDEDFQNIRKLGAGTKVAAKEKIGRFGLGFNAVYNLTDVPSFISREYIVFLDPNQTHMGKATGSGSGKANFVKNTKLIQNIPDQFQPYQNVFECNIKSGEYYDGTLFRLPLRTPNDATKSEICDKCYDRTQVLDLFDKLIQGAPDLLLFTQHVQKVEVHHLPQNSKDPSQAEKIFEMSKTVTWTDRKNINQSTSVLKLAAEKAENNQSAPLNLACEVEIQSHAMPYARTNLHLSDPSIDKQKWLVCWKGGKKCATHKMVQHGLVPLAAAALPLSENDGIVEGKRLQDGRVFCYLPLPINSGLPVHINGSFSIESSRRNLKCKTDDEISNVEADWNLALMGDAVTEAYIMLLQNLAKKVENDMDLHTFWPVEMMIKTSMEPLIQGFYTSILNNAKEIVVSRRAGKNIILEDLICLDPVLLKKDIGKCMLEVMMCHKPNTVQLSQEVLDTFQHVKLSGFIRSKVFTEERFFKEIFFPNIDRIDDATRDILVLYAIKQEQEALDDLIKVNACIPVQPSGKLRCPKRLLKPNCDAATLYKACDEVFPKGPQFNSPVVLVLLEKLGMRTEIDWDDMLNRATLVKEIFQKEDIQYCNTDRVRVGGILRLFIDHLERKLGGTEQTSSNKEYSLFQEKLREVEFLPIKNKPQNFPSLVPWHARDDDVFTLYAPRALFPSSMRYLVSASAFIAEDSFIPQKVKTFLGLTSTQKKADVEKVYHQLDCLLNIKLSELQGEEYRSFTDVVYAIYTFLQEMVKTNDNFAISLAKRLCDKRCILVNNNFYTAQNTAFHFSGSQHLSRFICGVPSHLAGRYEQLLKVMGVRQEFEIADYVNITQTLVEETAGKELCCETLKLYIELLHLLMESMRKEKITAKEFEKKYGTVYLPDTNSRLKVASSLCYKPKELGWQTSQVNSVHSAVSILLAKFMGVETERAFILKQHLKTFSFGQKEELTRRLKRIVQSYPSNHEMLKELIQNADDAGATEIQFILDKRHHLTDSIFEECWRPLQGPALCVYNNRPFTERDLNGIQKLGQGSKEEDPEKIGQYGIGFNAMYHITDAPALMTWGDEIGEKLCIFDPSCKFVTGTDDQSPGVMFDDVSGTFKDTFTDVFNCFLEDYVSLHNSTLFRFPLRNEDVARQSPISMKPITVNDMEAILKHLEDEGHEIMLFTRNISKLVIKYIESDTSDMEEIYYCKAELNAEDIEQKVLFNANAKEAYKHIRDTNDIVQIKPMQMTNIVTISDKHALKEKWIVTQKIGVTDKEKISESVKEVMKRKEMLLSPQGGVAMLLEKESPTPKLVPGIGCGKTFCFLPMPIKTKLPFHINGHFALDYENRRNLNDEQGGWNRLVYEDIIAPCYVDALSRMRDELNSVLANCNENQMMTIAKNYMKCLPSKEDKSWDALVQQIFDIMKKERVEFLPAYTYILETNQKRGFQTTYLPKFRWISPLQEGKEKGFYLSHKQFERLCIMEKREASHTFGSAIIRQDTQAINPVKHITKVCMKCGMYVFMIEKSHQENLKKMNFELLEISPKEMLNFFQMSPSGPCDLQCSLPAPLSTTPFQNIDILRVILQFCKKSESFSSQLRGTPLLADNSDDPSVLVCGESPLYLSVDDNLVPGCSHLFVNEQLRLEVFNDETSRSCFRHFDINGLAELLNQKMPALCGSDQPKIWDKKLLSVHKLTEIWNFIKKNVDEELPKRTKIEQRKVGRGRRTKWEAYEVRVSCKDHYNDCRPQIQRILLPLRNICLIPGHLKGSTPQLNEELLYSIANGSQLLSTIDGDPLEFQSAIEKLNLPTLSTSVFFGPDLKELLNVCVAYLRYQTSVLECLVHSCHLYNVIDRVKDLTVLEREHVLSFFKGMAKHSITQAQIGLLRSLPLYTTVTGTPVPLDDKTVYTLEPDIPTDGIDIWKSSDTFVFLKRLPELDDLYRALRCENMTTENVYASFIIPQFGQLNGCSSSIQMEEKCRFLHLKYIFKKYFNDIQKTGDFNSVQQKFVTVFQQQEFVQAVDGNYYKPQDLVDPEIPVLKVMRANEQPVMILPEFTLTDKEWLLFLRLLGMCTNVSNETFVKFAKEVACLGLTGGNDNTHKQSDILVEELFKCEDDDKRKQLYKAVKDIAFVRPHIVHERLNRLVEQCGSINNGNMPYVSLALGNYSSSYEMLVWSAAKLFPSWIGELDNAADDLKQEPDVGLVLRHLDHICDSCIQESCFGSEKCGNPKTRKKVLIKILKFLHHHVDQLSNDQMTKLRLLQCIPVEDGKHLVLPCQAVLALYEGDEICPYLYKLPDYIPSEIHAFLKDLGLTEKCSLKQYADVLSRIHKDSMVKGAKSSKLSLLAKDISSTAKAMRGFFTTLQETNAMAMRYGEDSACHKSTVLSELQDTPYLYLLTELETLQPSIETIFNDAPEFHERSGNVPLNFLVSLHECGVLCENPEKLLELLPLRIRPKTLTSIIKEKLTEDCLVHTSQSHFHIQERLTSEEFSLAIERVIHHEAYKSGTHEKIARTPLQGYLNRLGNIEVLTVSNLKSYLEKNGKKLPGSERPKLCFLQIDDKYTRATKSALYIEGLESNVQTGDMFLRMSEILNELLGKQLHSSALYIPTLLKCPLGTMNKELDRLQVRPSYTKTCHIENLVVPILGMPLSKSHNQEIDLGKPLDDLLNVAKGELVAYRGSDQTAPIYAVLLGQEDSKRCRIDIGRDMQLSDVSVQCIFRFQLQRMV